MQDSGINLIDANLIDYLVAAMPRCDLVDDIFPHMPQNDVFLAISDIVAHLEILINSGRVVLIDPGPPALYQSRY